VLILYVILYFTLWQTNENSINKGRIGYLTILHSLDELFQSADDKLFKKIVHNPAHVLQPLRPPPSSYDFRPRTHDKLLLNKTSYLNEREFLIRMLYKDSY